MGRNHSRTPRISAHRGGSEAAPGETYEAYRHALAVGADFIELDIRRTRDGTLVACHQEVFGRGPAVWQLTYEELCRAAGHEVPQVRPVLRLLAGHAGAHLDLKQADCALAAVREALEVLGPAGAFATTRDQALASALTAQQPGLPVGLTIGGDLAQTWRFSLLRVRNPRLAWLDCVTAAHADVAAIHRRLARAGVAARCHAHGITTVIWTVTGRRALAHWLSRPYADIVVTDRPSLAVDLRDQLAQAR
jgi:glycerophosphoryl diester phosphodiesterase